ncbi:hypothetical protein ACFSHQ_09780 [Gemmobacter lanyuensis]
MSPLIRSTRRCGLYAAVRAHPVLGPVFAHHVTDWPAHEEKISRFWRNAILREGFMTARP